MKTSDSLDATMSSHRKISLAAGVLYLLTFVSIPTLMIYGPVKSAGYILGAGPDTGAVVGGILEIIVALAGIGTAVVLFPILRKQNEGVALGFVGSRVLEGACIFVGVAVILAIVSLRQAGAGADALVISQTLATLYSTIFLISQSFIPAINDLLLGFLLYRSRLVPRPLALIGIVGAFPLVASWLAALFGVIGPQTAPSPFGALLVALFEFVLGVWLVVKGFDPDAVAELESRG
jgi:hypothetical protein